ncbi:MAG: NAD(P)-dependent glycerol-3-phosphate dehydrogenase [Deltaproteobacteria bacterium]|nr:NAD(P)-dependent glycerol-3-phosphate dehydrogenase [Deltaproteobacteria bacterium]
METKQNQTMPIAVIGGGSWGTALANLLGENGYPVDLWVYEPEVKEQIASKRKNEWFLPGIPLSDNITPSNDLGDVVTGKKIVLLVVPSHVMRETAGKMATFLSPGATLISASKGIENVTHLTMSGVLKEVLPGVTDDQLVILSGPSFAKEVGKKVPSAVTVASKNLERARLVQTMFSNPYFRAYTHADVIGVELGGAVKNVIALAAGVIDGLQLGLNTRAAMITRGLAEIKRLGSQLGADPETFSGLSGVGDLILTATGDLSRNHTVGKKIGQGHTLGEILSDMQMVAEGVKTAKSVFNLSRKIDVEMPICHAIYHVLYDGLSAKTALQQLMTRDLKEEF